jgi:hypothetical protein
MTIPVRSFTIKEPEALADNWLLYKVGPAGPENTCDHQYVLPRAWKPQEFEETALHKLDATEMTPVSQFFVTEPGSPTFEVTVTRWPWDIDLADFFEFITWQYGLKPRQMRHVEHNNLICWDGIFDTEGTDQPRSARVMVFKHNSLLYRVWGYSSSHDFNDGFGDIFEIGIETFQMETEANSTVIGKMLEYKTGFGVAFKHPDCWQVEERQVSRPDQDAVDLKLIDAQDQVASYHRVKVLDRDRYDREGYQGLLDRALDEWRDAGMKDVKVGEKGKLEDVPHTGHWYVATGKLNGAEVVLWVTVIQGKRYFATLSTLAPERRQNQLAWMAGKRVHTLGIETLEWE